ncbi:MAG: ribonuclease H-like domain-containing protein [Spirochaetales bacterium]|nr:ribonuclease H-like domain-containing protein [Spirochaetales bacterium]
MSAESDFKRKLDSLHKYIRNTKPEFSSEEKTIKNTKGIQAGTELPGFTRIGEYTYLRENAEQSPWKDKPADIVLATTKTPPSSLVFFDTETTGLSGGAGTLIFLIGLAHITDSQLCIDQYFLSDFPGEAEFLNIIENKLPEDAVYVSYNGKAFDSHLLFGRFLIHGKEKFLKNQYDLLFPCRRLWKDTIGSCTLKNIEARVLGIPRENDIDGFEVPERYFQFLRTGNSGLLEPVFHHNYLDVWSLAKIHFLIESIIASPNTARSTAHTSLAKMLFSHNQSKAEQVLYAGHEKGDRKSSMMLGFHLKRMKKHDEAFAIWKTLFETSSTIQAGIEMAKLLEHRERNYSEAKQIIGRMLESVFPVDSLLRAELLYRYERLERKLSIKGYRKECEER